MRALQKLERKDAIPQGHIQNSSLQVQIEKCLAKQKRSESYCGSQAGHKSRMLCFYEKKKSK